VGTRQAEGDMIRFRRGREPAALATVRQSELARVRLLAAVGSPTSSEIGTRYNVSKPIRWKRQHFKCCYCEHLCQLNFHDAEHYRPKASANRGPGFPSHGYWWLAWSWSKLMFACPGCNRSNKNDAFPLDAGSSALVAEQMPPQREQPLLIDPSAENPMPHIQFLPILKNGKRQSVPFARNGSRRGQTTIAVVGLDRPELLDLYEKHVADQVMPAVNAVRAAINTVVSARVREERQARIVPPVGIRRPYAALSYDVIDSQITRVQRRRWGLRLNRPR
jgi:hypothetical protein